MEDTMHYCEAAVREESIFSLDGLMHCVIKQTYGLYREDKG